MGKALKDILDKWFKDEDTIDYRHNRSHAMNEIIVLFEVSNET